MSDSTTLLVGTTKGAFILNQRPDTETWSIAGPHCDGWCINHMTGDPNTGKIWAGGGGEWEGAGVWTSEDGGVTWTVSRLSKGQRDEWAAGDPDFAKMIDWSPWEPPFDILQVWSLGYAHGTLFAGTKPATLLRSNDDGQSWEKVQSLSDHPSADSWNPGGAGLVLHTIVSDPAAPEKLWLGISAAGIFATDDGGQSWERRNRLSNAEECDHHNHPAGPSNGETGHCVHNIVRAPGDLLYQQNHHGVYRSRDGGRSWDNITEGLPSTFGFPIALHPRDPEMIWTIPLNGDSVGRYPPNASAAVWKSTDGGESWTAKQSGLPAENCFFTVLRQAMATDSGAPLGLFFGTNSGSIFASFDEGESWDEIARHLPTILSVETLANGAA